MRACLFFHYFRYFHYSRFSLLQISITFLSFNLCILFPYTSYRLCIATTSCSYFYTPFVSPLPTNSLTESRYCTYFHICNNFLTFYSSCLDVSEENHCTSDPTLLWKPWEKVVQIQSYANTQSLGHSCLRLPMTTAPLHDDPDFQLSCYPLSQTQFSCAAINVTSASRQALGRPENALTSL